MQNLKNILDSFTKEDFINQVNLHIHTTCSDGLGSYEQIVQSAKEKNYKLISITDHNTIEAHRKISDGILLTGAEFDCWYNFVFIHLLAYYTNKVVPCSWEEHKYNNKSNSNIENNSCN